MQLRAYGGPKDGQLIEMAPARRFMCRTKEEPARFTSEGFIPGLWKTWAYEVHQVIWDGQRFRFLLLKGHEPPSAERVVEEAVEAVA